MKIDLVPYDTVKTKRKGEVTYHHVTLAAIPKLRLVTNFGERDPDTSLLGRSLWTELERVVGTMEALACYYTTLPTPRHRVFVYARGRQVAALETPVKDELATWYERLTTKVHRGKHGCILLVHGPEQTGVSALMERDEEEVETAPVKVFKRWVPPSFNLADESKRKATFLAACEKKMGSSSSDDPARVEKLMRDFAARRKHALKTPDDDVGARLTALQQLIGSELPSGARAVWLTVNGAKNLFFKHDLLSLAQVEKEWGAWRDIYDEWPLHELQENIKSQPGITQQLYCCPRWIPMIDLIGGHYLAIDLLPGPKGHVGQLIVSGRDVETIRCIAPDMTTFLELCIEYAAGTRNALHSVFGELRF